MYMNLLSITRNNRLCKALTGLSIDEFNRLIPDFSWNLAEYLATRRTDRIRKVGAGPKGRLPTPAHKLAAVLIYLKAYMTFDVMGFILDMNRSNSCRDIHLFLKVLERTLQRKLVLPKRKITSVDEFFRLFPDARDVFIDATERRTQKPRSIKRRNKLYSGKKKATTRKNLIIADRTRRIGVLTVTKSGRRHDKRILDKNHLVRTIPPTVTAWVDTGFQGIQKEHDNTMMPKKRTKRRPLTDEERQENKLISSIRVLAEHAINGMKRYKAASDIYRNKTPRLDDLMTLLCAGLWNYHLAS